MIKRLKTGCQWRELLVKDFFGEENTAELVYFRRKSMIFKELTCTSSA
ncbi:hypothetical protein ODZ84_06125 [Chryseobacterium fluminis]|nr:hypothetical protein [Chryseobacterium sp. MMS21-Ot14]UZT99144.1 hypothetical protein ODZ84_06125 [Chryseobacterium sp. MMS21-Ot14]